MNDLWFGLAMVSLGACIGGAIGYCVFLLTRFMFAV